MVPPLERETDEETVVCYSLERSANTELEFVLHDQDYFPLFGIARTYSDWIGRKKLSSGIVRSLLTYFRRSFFCEVLTRLVING